MRVTIFDLNEEVGQTHADRIGGQLIRIDVNDDEVVAEAILSAESAHPGRQRRRRSGNQDVGAVSI